MKKLELFGKIFIPHGELPEIEENHKACKQCGTFHNKESEFCSLDCEDLFEWNLEHPDTETKGCDDYHSQKDMELE